MEPYISAVVDLPGMLRRHKSVPLTNHAQASDPDEPLSRQ